ncbi:MAG TPA: tyrosine-type recombinase/integrase [Solirubrobacteraceae bacterium]|nr:tyrosine-type recombinase/integrase [Solirubrobacteraceae bacterium]
MNPLHDALGDYLQIRRALGYKLERAGKLLPQYLDYLDGRGEQLVTVENALAWATLPAGDANWWAFRMSVVRGFASYLHALDPSHQVPPKDLLPRQTRRMTPYLYSDQEIRALMAASSSLRFELRQETYRTLIGLLSVTGMRVGEAIRLDDRDVDLRQGVLTVRETKFGKSRELPLHRSTVGALRAYQHLRDRHQPTRVGDAVFISPAGTRLLYCNVSHTFVQLVERAGVRPRSARCRPTLHGLRHSFAVRTLLGWYRSGVEVQPRLPLLSTYLGHVHPKDTYWYLTAAPELLQLAAGRLERPRGGQR